MVRPRSLHATAGRSGSDRLSARAALAVIGGVSLVCWAVLIGLAVYLVNG